MQYDKNHQFISMQQYSDIIHRNRPEYPEIQRKYPRMSLDERAKIFMPFAALRGHNAALQNEDEKLLLKERRILDELEMQEISSKLSKVQKGMNVEIQFFKEDTKEPGYGEIIERTGVVKKYDPIFHFLILQDEKINFSDIYKLLIIE